MTKQLSGIISLNPHNNPVNIILVSLISYFLISYFLKVETPWNKNTLSGTKYSDSCFKMLSFYT